MSSRQLASEAGVFKSQGSFDDVADAAIQVQYEVQVGEDRVVLHDFTARRSQLFLQQDEFQYQVPSEGCVQRGRPRRETGRPRREAVLRRGSPQLQTSALRPEHRGARNQTPQNQPLARAFQLLHQQRPALVHFCTGE